MRLVPQYAWDTSGALVKMVLRLAVDISVTAVPLWQPSQLVRCGASLYMCMAVYDMCAVLLGVLAG